MRSRISDPYIRAVLDDAAAARPGSDFAEKIRAQAASADGAIRLSSATQVLAELLLLAKSVDLDGDAKLAMQTAAQLRVFRGDPLISELATILIEAERDEPDDIFRDTDLITPPVFEKRLEQIRRALN